MDFLVKLLSLGSYGLSSSSADRVKLTNLLSISTSMLTLGYMLFYGLVLGSRLMVFINIGFAIGYCIPLLFNYKHKYNTGKSLYFIILIVHVSLLSTYTFTLASGFHLYIILVIIGVQFVFEYQQFKLKLFLSLVAVFAIFGCEYVNNQEPLIPLSATDARFLFQSTVFIMMVELFVIGFLFTHDLFKREVAFETQANTDSLTGLFNRRSFNTALTRHFELSQRYDRKFSLLLLDIDYFKSINDRYGHAAGDLVLKTLSSLIKKNIRFNDLASRVGGEEFAVILPETDEKSAYDMAEKLRQNIGEYQFELGDEHIINLTISIGVRSYQHELESKDQLYEQVDKALYQAKESGRDRTCVY